MEEKKYKGIILWLIGVILFLIAYFVVKPNPMWTLVLFWSGILCGTTLKYS